MNNLSQHTESPSVFDLLQPRAPSDYTPPTTVAEAFAQLDQVVDQLKLDPPMMTRVYDAVVVLKREIR